MLAPDTNLFPAPQPLTSGVEYMWAPADFLRALQEDKWELTNQSHDNNGNHYHLLRRGKPDRSNSSDNVVPSVRVIYPDEWDKGTAIAEDNPGVTLEGFTL